MSHPVNEIVANVLIGLGFGKHPQDPGQWPVFYSFEPANPARCITVYGSLGVIDGRSQKSGKTYEHPAFQVRVRSDIYTIGDAKIEQIKEGLNAARRLEVVFTDGEVFKIQSFSLTSLPIPIGRDPDTQRELFTLNARAAFIL
jgi:hypothetical protein